jgi:hypothetical protein
MKKIVAMAMTLGLFLAACGSHNNKADSSTKTTSASTAGKTTKGGGDVVKAKLLTVSDMPTGFTKGSEDSNNGDADPAKDKSADDEFCKELADVAKQYKTDGESTIEFQTQATGQGGSFFNEQLSHFSSLSDAKNAFTLFKKALTDRCKDLTDAASGLKGTFTSMSFPKVADDTFAVALDATQTQGTQSTPLKGQLIAIRKGDVLGLLFNFGSGSDSLSTSQVESLVRKAADKL